MIDNIQSQFCIEISSVICAAGQEITQKLFATDLFVYAKIADKQIIYLPEKEAQYLIDSPNRRLVKIDMSAQIIQFMQIKKMIGELSIEEKPLGKGKYLQLKNVNSSMIKFDAEVEIVEFEGLQQTILCKYEEFQSALRPFSVSLKPNEVVAFIKTCIHINGQIQESSMKLLDIKKIENANQFDQYLEFTID